MTVVLPLQDLTGGARVVDCGVEDGFNLDTEVQDGFDGIRVQICDFLRAITCDLDVVRRSCWVLPQGKETDGGDEGTVSKVLAHDTVLGLWVLRIVERRVEAGGGGGRRR